MVFVSDYVFRLILYVWIFSVFGFIGISTFEEDLSLLFDSLVLIDLHLESLEPKGEC